MMKTVIEFREGTAIDKLYKELSEKPGKLVPWPRLEKVARGVDIHTRLYRLRRAIKRTKTGTIVITEDGAKLLKKKAA